MISQYINIFLFGILFVFSGLTLKASQFNGIIHFQKIDGTDTTLLKYYVKDQYIRIEDVNGIMLINTEEASIVMLSNSKKVYINVPVSNKTPLKLNLDVEKTIDKMKVAGMDCVLWKATDKTTKCKYEFWVQKNGYQFFNEMLLLLNREEAIANVWLTLDVKDDYFPFVGMTYSSEGKLISKIEIIYVAEEDLPVDMFLIPYDYQIIRREN